MASAAIVTRRQRNEIGTPAAFTPASGAGGQHAPDQTERAVGQILKAMLVALGGRVREAVATEFAEGLVRLASASEHEHEQLSVDALCRSYWQFAQGYYRKVDGTVTTELAALRAAMRPLRRLYAELPAAQFRPLQLKAVREEMVKLGWCRSQVNSQVSRIKRMFKWAVEDEVVPPDVYHGLQAVAGLKAGRTDAPEPDPVKPVPQELIDAVLPHASRQVRAMIELQLITGMRPGEVCIMRTCDIDQSEDPWVYRPEHHKTEHHHHQRFVFLGPKSQEILAPFLNPEQPTAYLFSPAEADRERRALRHALRKTPLNEGNIPGSNRQRRPKRVPGERYETASYRRAISYAIHCAFPQPEGLEAAQARQWYQQHRWHPHQLRHNAATRLRKQFGIDAAQVILGHKTLEVTQVYAEKDVAAQAIMRQVG